MYVWLRYVSQNAPSYGRAGAERGLAKADFPFGEITTVTCQGRMCNWVNEAGTKYGGIELSDGYVESQEEGFGPMTIFAINTPKTEGGLHPTDCWGFRLYAFQIYEGDVLVRDFVPCVDDEFGEGGL